MNQKQKAKWEITRTKGFWRYIFVQWLLKSMLPSFLALSFGQYIGLFHAKIDFDEWLFSIPLFLFMYILAGVFVWAWKETMYK